MDKLRAAQAEEVQTSLRAARLQRTRDRWEAWVAWWKRRAKELAVAAKVSAALAAILGSWKAVALLHARDVGPPEQQSGGSERMATDRVEHSPRTGTPNPKD
jgi:hypothetical protein